MSVSVHRLRFHCKKFLQKVGGFGKLPFVRLVGQAVKTPPSHGGNRGSIPLRTTLRKNDGSCSFLVFSSGIEVVITGLTRNQFAGNRTGVRIPPAAHKKSRRNACFFLSSREASSEIRGLMV